MDPKIWGPHAWIFLHSITMDFPKKPSEKDKQHYIQFFTSLGPVIPCPKCRKNYISYLGLHPPNVMSRDHLMKWLFKLHNWKNREANKPVWSYKRFLSHYRSQYNKNESYLFNKMCTTVFIGIIITFLLYKCTKESS